MNPPRPQRRFGFDLIANMVSFAIVGVAGFGLNVVIGRFYGETALGVFSQVLALYLILSQVAAGGLYFSTLRFVSEDAADPAKVKAHVGAAMGMVMVQAALVAGVAWMVSAPVGILLDSPDVARAMAWVCPGIWTFAINKVLLAAVNAVRHMVFYAAAQALRFVFAFGCLAALTAADADATVLPVIFTVAEALLMVVLVVWLAVTGHLGRAEGLKREVGRHFHFARRAFLSGFLFDVSSKVDILMLGYFVGDASVGIYAFAALLAEGFGQLAVVVQVNVNPVLAQLKTEDAQDRLRIMVRHTLRLFVPAMAAVGAISTALFPWAATLLTGDPGFGDGVWVYAILAAGIVASSAWQPFVMILSQWGHPAWQTVLLAATLATNVVLNLVLIPLLGGIGAAVATAAAAIAMVVYLRAILWRLEGIRI